MDAENKTVFGHVFNRFTVIDFLGYLVPGALVTLYWNRYFGGIKEPFTDFFGNEPVMLSIYFVLVSYLAGTVIHESSKFLDALLKKHLVKGMATREKEGCTQQYFSNIFSISTEDKSESAVKRRYERIYHYIQPQLNRSKLPLFHAFSTFGRTGAFSVIAIAIMRMVHSGVVQTLSSNLLLAIIAVCLIFRCYRFSSIVTHYVYDLFDQVCTDKLGNVHCTSTDG